MDIHIPERTRPAQRYKRPAAAGRGWRTGATAGQGRRQHERREGDGRSLGVLDRPRWHVHRRGRPASGWHAGRPQAALGEPRPLRRSGRGRDPAPAVRPRRRAHSRPTDQRGPPRHHRRDECPAGAHGRAHRSGHHGRLRRRAADRLPGTASDLRAADHPARDGVLAGDRGGRADRPARRRHRPARRRAGRPGPAGRLRRRVPVGGGGVHARLPLPRARGADRRDRPRGRVHPGVGVARHQPADEAHLPRRHHAGGRLPVTDHRPLRGPGRQRTGRRPAPVHAVQRRAHRGAPVPGQGRDPVRARPAGSSAWPAPRRRRAFPA